MLVGGGGDASNAGWPGLAASLECRIVLLASGIIPVTPFLPFHQSELAAPPRPVVSLHIIVYLLVVSPSANTVRGAPSYGSHVACLATLGKCVLYCSLGSSCISIWVWITHSCDLPLLTACGRSWLYAGGCCGVPTSGILPRCLPRILSHICIGVVLHASILIETNRRRQVSDRRNSGREPTD